MVIPPAILVGLVVGLLPRPRYLPGLVLSAVGWAALLVTTEVITVDDEAVIVGAMALALVNTAIGMSVTKGIIALIGLAKHEL